jgi:uncharacterized protein (TIGR03437 family)
MGVFGLFVRAAFAESAGAPVQLSGAPGEDTCAACHTGGLNNSRGNVKINFPEASWRAGQTYRMSVTITDPEARRWGYQLSSRLASDAARRQGGALASTDPNSRLINLNNALFWMTHTSTGTRRGQAGPVSFEFSWTAPAAGAGGVIFYVAANAANNNAAEGAGDFVYTANLTVSEAGAGAGPTPAIRTAQPALPAFGGNPDIGFAANGYLEIYGTDLAGTSRSWAGTDFNGANAPTSLDGVSVKVNGKDAFIYYISPTQININTPEDPATGSVAVQVTRDGKTSNTVNLTKNKVAPALLTVPAFAIGGKKYVVALTPTSTANGPFVGSANLITGVPWAQVRPGDRIILYALGCGPTNPATQAGVASAGNSPVSSSYELRIGGQRATVEFFGVVAGSIGLYQINAVIPNVGAGDQTIELIVDGVSNNQGLSLSGVSN